MKQFIDDMVVELENIMRTRLNFLRFTPRLTIFTVGDDPASKVYVGKKKQKCEEFGIACEHVELSNKATQAELDDLVANTMNPMIVQLPLPNGLVCPEIPVEYDVDCLSQAAMGKIAVGSHDRLMPCTVAGCLGIMHKFYNRPLAGMSVAVIGRSNIVGKPLIMELVNQGCKVTTYNSKTHIDPMELNQYQTVITATGQHGVVDSKWLTPAQLVIDVGIIRGDGGKLVGDVKHSVDSKYFHITPVPFGVGRLTVMGVISNVLSLYEREMSKTGRIRMH